MPRPITLSDTEHAVASVLARLLFATVDQLVYWTTPKRSTVTKTVDFLKRCGLVSVETSVKPHVLSLTSTGYRCIGKSPPSGKRVYSWSVMAHRSHRNNVEIKLRGRYTSFMFQPRPYVYKHGLNPGHGEHLALEGDTDIKTLVLLDDYLMESNRIKHTWIRDHTANPRYWKTIPKKWCDVVQRYIIFTTDIRQEILHKTFVEDKSIKADVIYTPAIWKSA